METKKIDWDKLKKVIGERGSTMGKVSVEIGHDRSWGNVTITPSASTTTTG